MGSMCYGHYPIISNRGYCDMSSSVVVFSASILGCTWRPLVGITFLDFSVSGVAWWVCWCYYCQSASGETLYIIQLVKRIHLGITLINHSLWLMAHSWWNSNFSKSFDLLEFFFYPCWYFFAFYHMKHAYRDIETSWMSKLVDKKKGPTRNANCSISCDDDIWKSYDYWGLSYGGKWPKADLCLPCICLYKSGRWLIEPYVLGMMYI